MSKLALNKLDEPVVIVCYEQEERMTRREGLEKYWGCMRNSEGPEHQRYETIFFQLLTGFNRCDDLYPLHLI